MSREALVARTLVELADTLVDDFDVVDLLTLLSERCVSVLNVSAAGLMLAVPPNSELTVMAASNEGMHLLELYELQSSEGPCLDSFRTGMPVLHQRLADCLAVWPVFAPRAIDAGFTYLSALPLRLRGSIIGALNLFNNTERPMPQDDTVTAQALADMATIAILQHRAGQAAQRLNEQLNSALNSRVAIEQAKGIIAEQGSISVDGAFERIRTHARNSNQRLADVARAIITRELTVTGLNPPKPKAR